MFSLTRTTNVREKKIQQNNYYFNIMAFLLYKFWKLKIIEQSINANIKIKRNKNPLIIFFFYKLYIIKRRNKKRNEVPHHKKKQNEKDREKQKQLKGDYILIKE